VDRGDLGNGRTVGILYRPVSLTPVGRAPRGKKDMTIVEYEFWARSPLVELEI
jgi:hypothetical protein